MLRRDFLSTTILASGATLLNTTGSVAQEPKRTEFSLKFAPHFGMFKLLGGTELTDQLKFANDQGFRAWEDNGMKGRSVEVQQELARVMEKLGIEMGVVSALRGVWNKVNFAGNNQNNREEILQALKSVIDVAKRVNTKYLTVVPGLLDRKLPMGYQTANCIELLQRCCDIVEPHGLIMVLEPLNHLTNHPGTFLSGSPQAYQICKAVNRPSCKILFDIYHQQITEGNLIPNIDHCWDQIGYFQCGDNPGRKEPGTGEINYKNVFQHITDKGYSGIVGMEHGNFHPGAEGEQAVIDAYRAVAPVRKDS